MFIGDVYYDAAIINEAALNGIYVEEKDAPILYCTES